MMYMLGGPSPRQRLVATRAQYVIENDGGDGRGGADGVQPQPAVRILADGIVEAADDLWHVENEPRHLGRHDVAVVAVRDRDEGVGILDACAAQDIFIDPGADDRFATKCGGETA